MAATIVGQLEETKAAADALTSVAPPARPIHAGPWSYVNKAIMAPMVRISNLTMRLLAYHFGADICYSEEMIDRKIAKCIRRVNAASGNIEFQVAGDHATGTAFTTYTNEPVVMQLGTADAVLALKAATVVEKDVRAIDINMGCPKHFSLQGGMGAALLTKPELVHDIISTLTRNLSIPVTCKIRLLEKHDDTMRLIKAAESAGVSAIAIHARHISDRPRNPARVSMVPSVISQMSVPAIYNGDVFYHDDIQRMKKLSGASSVMIARGAQWNVSVFRSAGMLPVYDVCRSYITMAQQMLNPFTNTKYGVMEMLKGHVGPLACYQNVCNSRNFEQLATCVTHVSTVSPSITCAYVAPLDASLQAELNRRPSTSTTTPSDDTKTASNSTVCSDGMVNGGCAGPRKRRRQRQKEKRTRRLHTKYLRTDTTAADTDTNINSNADNNPSSTTTSMSSTSDIPATIPSVTTVPVAV